MRCQKAQKDYHYLVKVLNSDYTKFPCANKKLRMSSEAKSNRCLINCKRIKKRLAYKCVAKLSNLFAYRLFEGVVTVYSLMRSTRFQLESIS